MRLKMVVADSDQSYLSALEQYFLGNHSNRFYLSFFSTQEYLLEFLKKENQNIDILLVNTELFTEELEALGIHKIILLSKGNPLQESNHPMLNKYQPCDALVGKIIDLFAEGQNLLQLQDQHRERSLQSKILSIYSPTGGVGKTTVAIATATLLAQMGKRVFYLNFEGISSATMYLQQRGEYNASTLFYLMKNKKKNLALKLESMQVRDYATQIFYIESAESPLEWEEISQDDLEYLLFELQGSGMYDYIILDLSSNCDSKNLKIMSLSQKVITLLTPELTSRIKGEAFLKQTKWNPQLKEGILGKIHWMINRSSPSQEAISMEEAIINKQLPESREIWVRRDSQLVLNSSSDFAKALYDFLVKFENK